MTTPRSRRSMWVGLLAAGAVVAAGIALETRSRAPVRAPEDSALGGVRDARPDGGDPREPAARRAFRIDTHMHIDPRAVARALALMDRWGIAGAVNLSGMHPGPPGHALEAQLEAARAAHGRLLVFMTPSFMRALRGSPGRYGHVMAEELAAGHRLGARGLKISKGLGLGYPMPDGRTLMPVDDPGLDPLFEKAGELGMPVAIHTGDPRAFWQKPDAANERLAELTAHPAWSLHGEPVPSWEELLAQFERRVARHPRTIFIGVHFGNAPEEPERVARMLDTHPNLYIDTAARIPEIGRHDPARMRAFFVRYQDRILFATDTGIGETQEGMMYGSNGSEPPTEADEVRFFTATYRYFETSDRQFDHPTPIQGGWKIDGLGLPDEILRKVYFENAARVLRWHPAGFSVEGRKEEAPP